MGERYYGRVHGFTKFTRCFHRVHRFTREPGIVNPVNLVNPVNP
jgi:hypothetical protein